MALAGLAEAPANLTISATSFTFSGTTAVGSATTTNYLVTVSNTGGQMTSALAEVLSGAKDSFTASGDTCSGAMLSAGGSCTITVNFAPQAYGTVTMHASWGTSAGSVGIDLTGTGTDTTQIAIAITGNGGVTASGGGPIVCAAGTCTVSVSRGSTVPTVTFTENPGPSATFSGWGGICSSAGSAKTCMVTPTGAGPFNGTAAFNAGTVTVNLTVTAAGNAHGTVTGTGGISCSDGNSGTCTASVTSGSTVTLTAASSLVANGKFYYVVWGGDCASFGAASVCTLKPSATANVTLRFTPANIMFVTSMQFTGGGIGSVSNADGFCGTAAQSLTVATGQATWKAWMADSTKSINAATHLGPTARGWVRPDGLPFADTVQSIHSGLLYYPPRVTELGGDYTSPALPGNVWTGAGFNGAGSSGADCGGWTDSSADATTGDSAFSSSAFTAAASSTCSTALPIYCFGTDFTAVVSPSPAPAGAFMTFIQLEHVRSAQPRRAHRRSRQRRQRVPGRGDDGIVPQQLPRALGQHRVRRRRSVALSHPRGGDAVRSVPTTRSWRRRTPTCSVRAITSPG